RRHTRFSRDWSSDVCSSDLIRQDMVVAVALHGALLAGGTRIKKGKLRGAMSEGMFCSATELGLEGLDLPIEQREGILDLPADTQIGRASCRERVGWPGEGRG